MTAAPKREQPMPRKLVQRPDIKNIAEYEKLRPEFRKQVMALKDRRRMQVGPHFTFLFENYTTVLYQIQEMMRVERIVDDRAIAHEIETYNELIPMAGGLSATLLLEYDDRAARERNLPGLTGIEKHVWLELGELGRIPGNFDAAQIGEERVSAVQYVQFSLTPEQRKRWRELGQAGRLKLVVDHPNYRHEAVLPAAIVDALAEDLA